MKIQIVIPAHNEEQHIKLCIDSFAAQTRVPDGLIIVDDNSSDATAEIVEGYCRLHPWIKLVRKKSTAVHLPGKKVIEAFNYGVTQFNTSYDLVGKFDADIVLPPEYFEQIQKQFQNDEKLGMCSGLLYIKKNESWVYEPIADKSHIRGPIKLYSAACFHKMGGLRASIGWDTLDELLAKYHGFDTLTIPSLKVKHLRPTGASYHRSSVLKQGVALYKLRYDFLLVVLSSAKAAWSRRKIAVFWNSIKGYFQAKKEGQAFIVTPEEGKFIRNLRWSNIFKKLF